LTLQYVNFLYDFQELCMPHRSLTGQQRRSRDLNFVTKTSSKSPRLENLHILPKMFLKIFKKVSSPTSLLTFCKLPEFFQLAYFMLFLTCTYNRQKVFQLRSGWIKDVLL